MRIYMTVGALLGWVALLLQLYLMIVQSPPGAAAVGATIVTYLSFFTILSNLAVTLTLTFAGWIPNSKLGAFFSRPQVQAAMAVYIIVVGVTYSALLRHLWNPQGAQKLADVLLHDFMPAIYTVYWLIFSTKKGLRWKDAVTWLAYPGAYLIYILLRGAFVGKYPYHFTDVSQLGYPHTLVNAAGFLVIFLGLGLVVIVYARWRERPSGAAALS
jgi:hypothetical protein